LATLTGGSGAVAVLLTDGSFGSNRRHRLLGGVTQAAPEHHSLCRWGLQSLSSVAQTLTGPVRLDERIESVLLSTLPQKLGAVLPSAVARRVEALLLGALRQNIEGILPAAVSQRIEAVL